MSKRGQAIALAVLAVVVAGVVVASYLNYQAKIEAAQGQPGTAAPQPTLDPEPEQPVSLWVGDSYTAGTGASSELQGEACLTADRLGWICNLDAEGGTGFVNDGHINQKTYRPAIGRLEQDRREFVTPDVVVIDMGRNDGWNPEVDAAMRKYVARVDQTFPRAELVMIVPYYMFSTEEPYDGAVASAMGQVMDQYDGYLIDPFRSGWLGDADPDLLWTDDVHPSQAGHEYIARHLAADLRRLGVVRAVG